MSYRPDKEVTALCKIECPSCGSDGLLLCDSLFYCDWCGEIEDHTVTLELMRSDVPETEWDLSERRKYARPDNKSSE